MDERFTSDKPIDGQPQAAVPAGRLAILLSLLIVPTVLVLAILMKPGAARATLGRLTKAASLLGSKNGASLASVANSGENSGPRGARDIASRPPQTQAETLLQQAIGGSADALEQLSARMPDWQGQLTMTPRLSGLVDAAVNANDLRVRAAALDMELAANDLGKTSQDVERLIERIDKEPSARPWGLWMLGAVANRGAEPERALGVLVGYAHNPDENMRYWAVAGMSLVGSDPTVPLLLKIFHDDPSPRVRKQAGCGLAQAGMLTREQRRTALPTLVRYAGDGSLDAGTRAWAYQALRDITGASVPNDPAAWRDWLAENGAN